MARPRWKLTVRKGAEVSHFGFDDIDEAVEVMRERAKGIRSQGPPKTANVLRTFTPEQQVVGRLQLAGKGRLRKPVAGIDVRGDGTFVPFHGAVKREELEPSRDETPFELVRETLRKQER